MIRYQGISTLEVLEGANNYNKWIASELTPFMEFPALEIGSGIGNLSDQFKPKKKIVLSDNDEGLVKHLRKKFAGNKNIIVENLDITHQIKSKKGYYSSITAVNVFEHIKDDTKAFIHTNTLLRNKGKLLLLVPAKEFAFTQLDKELGHYRRYEKDDLIKKLQSTGFTIDKIHYFNFVGLLSWMVRDKVERRSIALKPYQIKLFDLVVPLLRLIESLMKPPVGISLIVIATKNG
jgi:2-polyprenyl-3-methyl-5-hydroxy-6-metoxy-1,4-benzoquinol methylase